MEVEARVAKRWAKSLLLSISCTHLPASRFNSVVGENVDNADRSAVEYQVS